MPGDLSVLRFFRAFKTLSCVTVNFSKGRVVSGFGVMLGMLEVSSSVNTEKY